VNYSREDVEKGLKNYFGDKVLFYVKFTKEEWARDISEGNLYMKTIGYYRQLEAEKSSKGQGDKCELLLSLFFSEMSFKSHKNDIEIPINPGKVIFEFGEDKNKPAFCISGLTIDDMILDKWDENNISMNWPYSKEDIDFIKEEFGEYVVILMANEFEQRINNSLNNDTPGIFKKVQYVPENSLERANAFFKVSPDRFFFKNLEFKNQREYRIVLNENIEDKKIMKIADLQDISHVMRIEDFSNLQFSFKCILEK